MSSKNFLIFFFIIVGSICGQVCQGLTEVELWGEWYDIESTTELGLSYTYMGDGVEGLTGSIPPEIGCLTNLTFLTLANNQFTGEIPPEIGNLTNLTELYLYGNQLTGSIPPEIGNLENLTLLYLQENELTGEIPSSIGNLTNLTRLRLDDNQLTGGIPPEIGNLTYLIVLYLRNNQLSGLIPEEICNTGINNFDGWTGAYYYFSPLVHNNQLCPPYPECPYPHLSEYNVWDVGYQDTSECEECSETNGDINNDSILNIIDIVSTVNCILPDSCDECSDMNGDDVTNILDIVLMVNVIMDI